MDSVTFMVIAIIALTIIIPIIVIANKSKFKATVKQISETRCTCQACGTVWYYGKKEAWDNQAKRIENFGKNMSDAGSDMACCGGCLPAAFLPKNKINEVKDLNKCPKCNSSAVKKEEVTHEVK